MVTADRLESRRVTIPRRFSCSIPASAASRYCVRSSAPGPMRIMSMSPTTRSFPTATTARSEIIARVVPLVGELIASPRARSGGDRLQHRLHAGDVASARGLSGAVRRHRARDQAGLRRSKTKRVSVLGTKGTVKREYTKRLIEDFAQGCEVTLVGSAELASLAEVGAQRQRRQRRGYRRRTRALLCRKRGRSARTDTVVLACTHYPLLLDRLVKLAPWPVDWIDPAPAIARRVADLLGPANGRVRSGRRRNDFHLEAAAHAEPGADAVFRRPRAGVSFSR